MSDRPNSLARRRLNGTGSYRAGSASGRPASQQQSAAAPSTGAATAPAEPLPPAVLWKVIAADPVDVYDHPNGIVVAHASPGELMEETTYFVDYFGVPWIAVMSSDDASVAWVRRYAPCALDDTPTEIMTEVTDEEPPVPVAKPSHGVPVPAVAPDVHVQHEMRLLPNDAATFGEFWAKRDWVPLLGAAKNERDWNAEYQSLVEQLVHSPSSSNAVDGAAAIRERIQELYGDFAEMCQSAISTIVGEMFSPQAERTVKSVSLGSYFYGGAHLRICYDTTGGVYAGDANAMKVASQQLRAYSHVAAVAPRYLLHTPLVFIMTHLGFRVVASTIPPVSLTTQLPADTLQATQLGTVGSMVADLCRELKLKQHRRGGADGSVSTTQLPVDTGVFWGRDGRLYLLNTGRIFPPIAPSALASGCDYNLSSSPLHWRLRPELVCGIDRPLNPDSFLKDSTTREDNEEVANVCEWLRSTNIPTTAAVFSMLEPTLAETPTFTCNATRAEMSKQLAFVVCTNEDQCCMIGPQGYVDLVKVAHWQDNPEAAHAKLMTYVKCGAQARLLHGLVMVPDVTSVMHAHGVNLRYLGQVWAGVSQMSRPCVSHYLEVEMVARAAKHLLWRSLRQAQDVEERRVVCINFFLALLQPEGDIAETFWAEDLGPAIAKQFGVCSPFDTSRIDPFLLHSRIGELTGIELTPESLSSFYTDEPFVQLQAPHPRMKNARLPEYVSVLGERKPYVTSHRDALNAVDKQFRAKFAVSPSADRAAEHAAVTAGWTALVPSYLDASDTAVAGGAAW